VNFQPLTAMVAATVADEDLARAARDDPAAFADLYVRHRELVFRYLRARSRTDDDAIELTAVTFERALGSIGRYRPIDGGLLAWLVRIARNALIDDEGRRRARPFPIPFLASHEPTDARTPESVAVAADGRRELTELLSTLPRPQGDAIAMRFGAGLTAKQIGAVIGKSEDATQKLISRGLARLQEVYPHDD
jgi:RNA polymerase sigma-70 factor, ECF subfamily